MENRFTVKCLRRALLDAYPAGIAVGFNPGVIVPIVEWKVLDAGENCC
jgi:hypothetical protein